MRRVIYILLFLITAWGCQKENYDLPIPNTEPVLIVDARVQSEAKNAIVNLSQSTDFYGDNPQNFIGNASVFIAVNGGDEQELLYLDSGNYRLDSILVEPGTEYALRIVWNGEEYTSATTMKEIVPVSLFLIEETPGFGGNQGEKSYNFNMILEIDLSQTNYYLTETFVYDTVAQGFDNRSYLMWDDMAYASNPALFPFFVADYREGDSLYVKFSQVTFETYDFYNSLSDVAGQNPSSLAPANPISNISNGAIGDFGAYATFEARFVVRP